MQQLDYIVVGLGIGGLSFCEQLRRHHKKFVVIDAAMNPATAVSGGVINPVVLKRFTPVWQADEFLSAALPFYKHLSQLLDLKIIDQTPILRVFNSVEEQNDWTIAGDRHQLAPFISSEIISNKNSNLNAPFGLGRVNAGYRLQTSQMLQGYADFLLKTQQLIAEELDHSQLIEAGNGIRYKHISARKIVFAEGFSALRNPLFPKHLIIPNKGEYITIHAPQLKLEDIVKGAMFVIPQGRDEYKVGATFNRDDISERNSEVARKLIENHLKKLLNCEFTVVDQMSGIRPTTKDRRPLLGTVTTPDIAFLNGLGARGLMMAPLLAEHLYKHLEEGAELPVEVNLKRFL